MLIMSHSYSVATHITNNSIITFTLDICHCPAAFKAVLMIVHTMKRIRLSVKEKTILRVNMICPYAKIFGYHICCFVPIK